MQLPCPDKSRHRQLLCVKSYSFGGEDSTPERRAALKSYREFTMQKLRVSTRLRLLITAGLKRCEHRSVDCHSIETDKIRIEEKTVRPMTSLYI